MYKKYKTIKQHFDNNGIVLWNDPDFMKNNDYKITFIEEMSKDDIDSNTPILIQYNNGLSEA